MTIREQINQDMKQAMKERQSHKLETLRFIWSAIKNSEIDAKKELSDEEVIKLLRVEVKRRKESIEQFKAGDRTDLAQDESQKLTYIEAYLPQLMSENQIGEVVDQVVQSGETDFGKVMGQVMAQIKGQADGGLVSKVVREKLR